MTSPDMSDGQATMVASPTVSHPGLPQTGLHLRQEFVPLPVRSTRHAMLSLHSQSGVRMVGFPDETIAAVNKTLQAGWSAGIESTTSSTYQPGLKDQERYQGTVWNAKLWGNPWRKTGKEELESVRLILELFTTLAGEGWSFDNKVTVGGGKGDTHTMLFTHDPTASDRTPAFFAISFPLPNRISVISPPPSVTPTILSAIRKAVASRPFPNVQPKSKDGAIGIKHEGFIFSDCYAFKISGVSSMVANGFGRKSYEISHPPMLLSLLTDLDANHFKLVTSLSLLPFAAARDLLIFSSLPSSGITSAAPPRDPRKLPWHPELSIVTDPRGQEHERKVSTESSRRAALHKRNGSIPQEGIRPLPEIPVQGNANEQWVMVTPPNPVSATLPTAATTGHSVRPLDSAKIAPSESSATTHYTDFALEEIPPSAGFVPVQELNATAQPELTINPALKSMHGSIGYALENVAISPPLPERPPGEMQRVWEHGGRKSLEKRNVPNDWIGERS